MNKGILAIFLVVHVCAVSAAQTQDSINRFDKEGRKQGKWIRKDEQGRNLYTGSFLNDLPLGKFVYYYPNGKVKSITFFYKQANQAYTQFFNAEGRKVSQGKVIGENKDSTWLFYGNNDSLMSVENYRNGVKQGSFLTYYTNRKLLEEKNYKNDVLEGRCRQFYDNGGLKADFIYVNGLHNGKARFYYPSGQISVEGAYLNDFKEGTWNFYEENGTLDWQISFKKSSMLKSKRYNGVDDQYYPDKIPKSKIAFENGLKNGPFTEYYDLGEIKVETIPEKDGFPEEKKETVTGQKVKRKGVYLNDKLEGKVSYYKEDGTLDREETYKEGILIK